jgi:cell division protein FtsW
VPFPLPPTALDDTLPAPPRVAAAIAPAAIIVVCCAILAVLGLVVLSSAAVAERAGPLAYVTKQVIGLGLAGAAAFVVSRLDLEYLRTYVLWIAAAAVLLMLMARMPGLGVSVNGSHRWIQLAGFRFQVSEIGKIATVFCLAHYLALNQAHMSEFKRGFFWPLAIVGGFGACVMLGPDFGTTALLAAVGIVMLFLAGARWRYIFVGVGLLTAGFTALVLITPNRLARFTAFLDVEGNRQAGTYQLYQSILAFVAGGWDGVGLGQGRQQLDFLPEAHTDFIFAVIGEELGLFFTLGVVGVFIVIFVAGLVHLRRAPNLFQHLLVVGCLLLMCLQAIINLGVVVGIFPTKGMSLPFISAGMSNLLLMGMIVGVVLNTQRAWNRAALMPLGRQLQEVTE